jgi:thiol:disulfide interchange protein DsbA
MQRREFSLSAATVVATSLGGAMAISPAVQAQGKPPQEGTDYLTLDKPVPTEAPAGKVEVIEFFWYSCPHCNHFEPQWEAWIKKAPKDIVVRRVPVSFRPDFEPQQRLYYALESIGKVDDMQFKVFNAIHVERQQLTTADQILAWIDKQPNINKVKFAEAFNSFPVATKARKATQLQDLYKVQGVPALGIAGRYYTDGSQAGSMERALVVTEYLVGMVKKSK